MLEIEFVEHKVTPELSCKNVILRHYSSLNQKSNTKRSDMFKNLQKRLKAVCFQKTAQYGNKKNEPFKQEQRENS